MKSRVRKEMRTRQRGECDAPLSLCYSRLVRKQQNETEHVVCVFICTEPLIYKKEKRKIMAVAVAAAEKKKYQQALQYHSLPPHPHY